MFQFSRFRLECSEDKKPIRFAVPHKKFDIKESVKGVPKSYSKSLFKIIYARNKSVKLYRKDFRESILLDLKSRDFIFWDLDERVFATEKFRVIASGVMKEIREGLKGKGPPLK